jgi:hypothetical protein
MKAWEDWGHIQGFSASTLNRGKLSASSPDDFTSRVGPGACIKSVFPDWNWGVKGITHISQRHGRCH